MLQINNSGHLENKLPIDAVCDSPYDQWYSGRCIIYKSVGFLTGYSVRCNQLFFFEDQPIMIHDFFFKTDLIGAYFKNSDLMPKFFIGEILWKQRKV